MTFAPPVPPPTTGVRPKWLSVAAIGVIVVAVFLIVTGLTTPISVAFVGHNPFLSLSGVSPQVAKMLEWQEKMMAFPAPLVLLVVGAAGLVAGVWGLSRAVGVLSRKPGVRTPFRRSIVALAAVESVSSVVSVWLQTRSSELAGELVEAMAPPGASLPAVDEMMGTFFRAFMLVGLVVTVAWGAIKIAFLAWAHRYAGEPNVVAFLDH